MSLPEPKARTRPAVQGFKDPATTATLLGMCTVVLLTLTAPDIGLTWDEPACITASESYMGWFGQLVRRPAFALSQEGIDTCAGGRRFSG